MELEKLYKIANKNKLNIYDYYFTDIKGLFLNYGSIKAIAINYKNIENSIDEKCVLAEELGHFFYNATYSLNADINTINKMEYKAKKWSSMALVPISKLKKLIKKNYSVYEICEKLEITNDVLENAIKIYKNKGVL